MYGSEIWCLALREEHRVFEKCVLRGAFRTKRDVTITKWRTLHNEEFHNFYCLPSVIRMIKSSKMGLIEHVARMGRR